MHNFSRVFCGSAISIKRVASGSEDKQVGKKTRGGQASGKKLSRQVGKKAENGQAGRQVSEHAGEH